MKPRGRITRRIDVPESWLGNPGVWGMPTSHNGLNGEMEQSWLSVNNRSDRLAVGWAVLVARSRLVAIQGFWWGGDERFSGDQAYMGLDFDSVS